MTSPNTKPGHKVEIPVVAHTAGSHSPQWKMTQRNSRLIQLRLNIVAEATRMALNTVSKRLRGSNYGFFIRVLHLLEGLRYRSKEFLLPQCLRLILVWFFLRVYSRSLSLTKSIHKAVEAKQFYRVIATSAPTNKEKSFSLMLIQF